MPAQIHQQVHDSRFQRHAFLTADDAVFAGVDLPITELEAIRRRIAHRKIDIGRVKLLEWMFLKRINALSKSS